MNEANDHRPLTDQVTGSPRCGTPLQEAIRRRTPARILVGRAGPAYRTSTQLQLRQDHAAALDAVHTDLDLQRDFGADFVVRWQLLEVHSRATNKREYLLRPDLVGASPRCLSTPLPVLSTGEQICRWRSVMAYLRPLWPNKFRRCFRCLRRVPDSVTGPLAALSWFKCAGRHSQ